MQGGRAARQPSSRAARQAVTCQACALADVALHQLAACKQTEPTGWVLRGGASRQAGWLCPLAIWKGRQARHCPSIPLHGTCRKGGPPTPTAMPVPTPTSPAARTHSQVSVLCQHGQHGNVAAQALAAVHIHLGNHGAKAALPLEHQEAQVGPIVQKVPAGRRGRGRERGGGSAEGLNGAALPVLAEQVKKQQHSSRAAIPCLAAKRACM